MKIEGSTILVTGASSGIGAALAPMLAARGATVGIVARRKDRLEEVLARCVEHAPGSRLWAADLGDLDAAERVAREAWDAFEGVDCLVNNAAIPKRMPVQRLTREEVDTVMRVNFTSPVRMTFALLPDWLARDSGCVVNVSSMGGRIGIAHEAAYCASKFALCGWSESMAIDLHDTGVEVKLVLPGPIDTEIWDLPDNDPALYDGPFVPADECAASIVDAIEGDGFESYVPPEFPGGLGKQHDMVIGKTTNPDAFIDAMGQMARPVKALVFGVDSGFVPEPAPADDSLEARLLHGLANTPMALQEVPDPALLGPDWVVLRSRLTGICGSDTKQVFMDMGDDASDFSMTAFISFPQVLGHEVIADVVEVGPEVGGLEVGQRVALQCWLSCGPRGISPMCPACEAGDFSLCWSFTDGRLTPGIHTGNSSDATGGFAELLPAHHSMAIPIPDDVPDEIAVLADPFAVSLHAITRNPPPPSGRALVWGAGALGTCAIAILRSLYPQVEVAAVVRHPAQQALARELGAHVIDSALDDEQLVVELATWSGGRLHQPWAGLPIAHPGGIDVCYDTIASPKTIELALRVIAERGTIALSGVHAAGRFEWSPWYFKEVRIAGSNAFGMEEVEGVRKHAIEHYLDLAWTGRVDVSAMLTHTFALDDWREAFETLAKQHDTGAIKAAFDFRERGS